MLFLKFGKKEHLESLREGLVHLSPLQLFNDDMSSYRGDAMEGKLLLDTSKPFLVNGMDISPFMQRCEESVQGYEDILIFSVAKTDKNNTHCINELDDDGNQLYSINDSFIDEMSKFGDYVLLFSSREFISSFKIAMEQYRCNYVWQEVFYCNKDDYDKIGKYLRMHPDEEYGRCFIKDYDNYALQNEWRFIVHDYNHVLPNVAQTGVEIRIPKFTQMPIFETQALKTLKSSKHYIDDTY